MAPARDESGFHLNEEAFNDTAADEFYIRQALNLAQQAFEADEVPAVSYTHLTLPTNREV